MNGRRRRARRQRATAVRAPDVLTVAAASVGAVALFAVWHVLAERTVYFWDAAASWRAAVDLGERLRHDAVGALGTVLRTIRRDEQNLAAVLPLAPATIAFGASRLAHVLALVLVYGFAALASIALFVERAILLPLGASRTAVAFAIAVVGLLPAFWAPVLSGLPDVAGCALVPWIWLVARPPLRALPVRRLLLAGVLLALLVVLRRWYALWGLALLVALAIESAWQARRRAAVLDEWARLGLVAAAALGALLLTTGPDGLVLADPGGELHGADRAADPLRAPGARLLSYVGPPWLAGAAAGALVALRAPATRPLARLLLLQSAVIVLLFVRVPSFAGQHLYLLVPQVQVFAAAAVALAADLRAPLARRAARAAVAGLAVLAFAYAFVPGAESLPDDARSLFGPTVRRPERRGDLDELARLVATLDELTRARHDRIYVLSSSTVLNDDLLRNVSLVLPSLPDLGDRVVASAHVDRRDGFPWALAQARYVVVTEPIGFHRDPHEQRVVGLPAEEILAGSTIGEAFTRLPLRFALDGGTTALLYARTRELTRADVDGLRAALEGARPGGAGSAGR